MSRVLARHWLLDAGIDFLNHGSFGACPREVLDEQQRLREELEREPVEFLARRLPERLDAARERLSRFVGATPEGLVALANATTGVNVVLRSLRLERGDELLVTDHAYAACDNALAFVAERRQARVVRVRLPFPGTTPEAVVETVLAAAGPRTRLALLDHVTSPTGLVLPIETLVRRLAERGIDTLVDGAHAPGMLPLELDALASAYYVGNCHKWLCAPKGAGFLWVREDRREAVRPLVISHGASLRRTDRSSFHSEFDWTGTGDPTAFLCVPAALDFLESLVPGGWPAIRRHNRELALEARRLLCSTLGIEPPCPDSMLGSLAAVPLPDGSPEPPRSALYLDPLQERLLREHAIEVPLIPWPAPPRRLLRVSAQLYNAPEQYERLAGALRRELVS